jgi:hypothetical protein
MAEIHGGGTYSGYRLQKLDIQVTIKKYEARSHIFIH